MVCTTRRCFVLQHSTLAHWPPVWRAMENFYADDCRKATQSQDVCLSDDSLRYTSGKDEEVLRPDPTTTTSIPFLLHMSVTLIHHISDSSPPDCIGFLSCRSNPTVPLPARFLLWPHSDFLPRSALYFPPPSPSCAGPGQRHSTRPLVLASGMVPWLKRKM